MKDARFRSHLTHRVLVALVSAALLAAQPPTDLFASLALLVPPQAAAADGFDAEFSGQSAIPKLVPGGTAVLAAYFANTGTTGWQLDTDTQVNLAGSE